MKFAFIFTWLLWHRYKDWSTEVFRYFTAVIYFISVILLILKSSNADNISIIIQSGPSVRFLFNVTIADLTSDFYITGFIGNYFAYIYSFFVASFFFFYERFTFRLVHSVDLSMCLFYVCLLCKFFYVWRILVFCLLAIQCYLYFVCLFLGFSFANATSDSPNMFNLNCWPLVTICFLNINSICMQG